MTTTPALTNPRAERVRRVAALARRQQRQASGRFLVEGPGPVGALLAAASAEAAADERQGPPPPRVEAVYATMAALAKPPLAGADPSLPVHTATDEVVAAMADTVAPQGLVAVAHAVDLPLSALLQPTPRTVAVLAQVRDPGNAGTVVRAADAAGADGVVLSTGSVDVHSPKTVRSSAGSLFHVPVAVGVAVAEALTACRAAGLTVLATAAAAETDLDALLDDAAGGSGPLCEPHAWLFGNEAWGLPAADLAAADLAVAVPLHGRAESLNLAMAATLCLYASARARRAG